MRPFSEKMSTYEYYKFTVATATTNYDVKTQQSAFSKLDRPIAGKIRIITDQTISVRFNTTSNDAIEITSSQSEYVEDCLNVSNIYITNTSGNTANIKLGLYLI